jgi:hypothetical protein
MKEEMASIEQNKTWALVDLPSGHKPTGLKLVFKVKRDEKGAVVKHKAHLVAKGYVQREGFDFEEVFAPVARLDSAHLLLAVAVQEKWELHRLDVKSAFLNGELEEEVYVAQPLDSSWMDRRGRCCDFTRHSTGSVKLRERGTRSWSSASPHLASPCGVHPQQGRGTVPARCVHRQPNRHRCVPNGDR